MAYSACSARANFLCSRPHLWQQQGEAAHLISALPLLKLTFIHSHSKSGMSAAFLHLLSHDFSKGNIIVRSIVRLIKTSKHLKGHYVAPLCLQQF